jgi:transcriptional regulator with XRE-family HTH domain
MNEKYEKIRRILAQNIKSRRENLGLSQEKLAEAANLSVQTINTIEGCRMWVSDKSITRLARALDLEVFQLFVPYYANRNELKASSAAVLLELRQKVKSELDSLNLRLDADFNEALKSPIQRQAEREASSQKPGRDRPKRSR